MTEADIKHENGRYWVLLPRSGPNKGIYCVMRNEVTHSVTLEGYTDQSVAVERAEYLAKRERTQHEQVRLTPGATFKR